MRVAVWNMSHWSRTPAQREAAWSILVDELRPDVALLQETVAPPDGSWSCVYRPIGGARPWGSAVVGFTVDVEEVTHAKGRANSEPQPLLRTWPGSVAIATAPVRGRSVTLVSMYGLIDQGYADTTVHRHLSDLAPMFDDPAHEGRIILGGDLNITTQWTGRHLRYRDWETATFARMAALGLVDCLDLHREPGQLSGCECPDGHACRHIQTQRHRRSSRPWQNDYLWASRPVVSEAVLESAGVHDSAAVQALGDHLPLLAHFRTAHRPHPV